MARTSLQAGGGAFTSLDALDANFDDLYSYYGVAAGNPFSTDYFVDGSTGNDNSDGLTPSTAKATIQGAINAAGQGDRIFIAALEAESASGDTDPDSYAETLTITGKDGLSLIGVSRGLAQGGQPQIRIGSGSTALLTVNAFGCSVHNLTFNGAGATGGGIKLVANGSTQDAGGFIASGCHFKNCKGSAAAASGGAIYWTTYGGAWYVSIYDCEFIDNRAGICMLGSTGSVPQHVKIVGNRFGTDPNTDNDADIYVAGSGIKNLFVVNNTFATVDVPAYASSPDAARYIKLAAGTTGTVAGNTFACIASGGSKKTFGAAGDAAIIPTTVRMPGNYGEGETTAPYGLVFRT